MMKLSLITALTTNVSATILRNNMLNPKFGSFIQTDSVHDDSGSARTPSVVPVADTPSSDDAQGQGGEPVDALTGQGVNGLRLRAGSTTPTETQSPPAETHSDEVHPADAPIAMALSTLRTGGAVGKAAYNVADARFLQFLNMHFLNLMKLLQKQKLPEVAKGLEEVKDELVHTARYGGEGVVAYFGLFWVLFPLFWYIVMFIPNTILGFFM